MLCSSDDTPNGVDLRRPGQVIAYLIRPGLISLSQRSIKKIHKNQKYLLTTDISCDTIYSTKGGSEYER